MRYYQPYTTDQTIDGLRIARNAMRERLWNDDVFAHRWLCHPGEECQDGCTGEMQASNYAERLALYQSELEEDSSHE